MPQTQTPKNTKPNISTHDKVTSRWVREALFDARAGDTKIMSHTQWKEGNHKPA